jgi:hypothetical protein
MGKWRDIIKELDTDYLRYAIYCLIFAGVVEALTNPRFNVIPSNLPTLEYGLTASTSRIPWETIDRAAAVVGLLLAAVQVVQWAWQIASIVAKQKKQKSQSDFES